MDQQIIKVFEENLNKDLIGVVISNSTDKENISKVKIRPILLKGDLLFQASEFKGQKIFHSNYTKEELLNHLIQWLNGLFRQVEIKSHSSQTVVLISKKGKVTVNRKMKQTNTESSEQNRKDTIIPENLFHNKKKNYILEEGKPLPFLIDLGVMTQEGAVIKSKFDKFRQINRFLEFIEDVLSYLDRDKEVTILDFGCGKSYLTFALYYYLKELKGYQINVIGLDLKADVIEKCNKLSNKYGYDKLQFLQGDIASYNKNSKVDMVVSLHACDTATDYAIYKAVGWEAKVILSVPCCQHELNNQIQCETLNPVLKYGIIKERMAALITDALRAEVLEAQGYRVQLLEFIDMEHTPKNILIRAVKRTKGNEVYEDTESLDKCMNFLGVSPRLNDLLKIKITEEGK
ncbi:SAM-dependent methyltransferase [Mobilitalea sibirica]|uniref:SAM-dependent methyltransferase n=1 Tax=Mobilitalea sibirica TaxID=1462919 RepID=A0A8J7GYQ0_9FIRM|nr:SAM-dependent methyltransferase [Mobilitalea sibirica]MBH1940719.1 SAM-dependent methyltransferase [Mobilitalea sibirica]